MFSLSGKTALVTGGSRGIGAGIAVRLSRAGAHVWVHYNSSPRMAEEVVEAIVADGGHASTIGANVGISSEVDAMVATIEGAGGQIDILVNNAGINIQQHLVRMKDQEIMEVLQTNLLGVIYCSRAVLPGMRKRRLGRLIHISSIVADLGSPMQTIYCASKAAVRGFSNALSKEYANRGITSNIVSPGLIDTDMTRELPVEQMQAILDTIPVGRAGQPADVAAAVHFLASDEAAFITSAEIDVNGGAL